MKLYQASGYRHGNGNHCHPRPDSLSYPPPGSTFAAWCIKKAPDAYGTVFYVSL